MSIIKNLLINHPLSYLYRNSFITLLFALRVWPTAGWL